MTKWMLRIGFGIVAIAVIFLIYMYSLVSGMQVTKISDDLHMISGMGSNVGVLRTDEGAVIVDTMTFGIQGKLIRRKAKKLTGQDVVMIINTHYHFDHTHGNPAFDAGTRVVSTERTLHYLKTLDAEYWEGKSAALLPNETFEDTYDIAIGGKTLRLFHPGRGHTDGDLVVLFVEEDTLQMGDLFFNKHYPNIDLEGGGSVQEWGTTIEAVLGLPYTKIIPGHGALTDQQQLRQYQSFMEELAQAGRTARDQGWSLEKTLEVTDLQTDEEYTKIVFGPVDLGLDRDFVVTRAWQEATGALE